MLLDPECPVCGQALCKAPAFYAYVCMNPRCLFDGVIPKESLQFLPVGWVRIDPNGNWKTYPKFVTDEAQQR